MTGAAIGTPLRVAIAGLMARSWVRIAVEISSSAAMPAMRSAMTPTGSVTRPRRARPRCRRNWTSANPATAATARPQLHPTGRLSLFSDLMKPSGIEMFLPSPSRFSSTPWKARNAARVTTKDGMPTFDTSRPSSRPITTPVTSAATSEMAWL